MNATADVVIVGAGVMGCSLAFHLAKKGVKNVVVLDKGAICSGMSFRSGALVRLHYTNDAEARVALKAYEYFHNWSDIVGGDCGFVNTGFLFDGGPEHVDLIKKNVERLRSLGVNTEFVGPAVIKEAQPFVNLEGIGGGAYEPDSGYTDPQKTTHAFAEAARRLGATFREGCAVTGIRVEGGRAIGVDTVDGPVDAGAVVLMTGPWTTRLLSPLGIDVPIQPRVVQVALYRRPAELAQGHMVFIDRAAGMYFRPNANRLTFIGAGERAGEAQQSVAADAPGASETAPPDPDHVPDENTPEHIEYARQRLAYRIPLMADAAYAMGHHGVYDMTPDGKAILDRAPGIDNLNIAAGFSGTGFKKSPAIGLLMSELIVEGEAKSVDIHPFRLSRFTENDPIQGPYEYGWVQGAQLRL